MEYFRDICRKLKVNFMSIRIFYKNLLHFSMMASSAIGFHNEIPSMIIVSSYRCVVPSPTPHLLQGDFQDCTFTCTPPAWLCSCTGTCAHGACLKPFLPNSRPGQIKVAPAVLHLRSSCSTCTPPPARLRTVSNFCQWLSRLSITPWQSPDIIQS